LTRLVAKTIHTASHQVTNTIIIFTADQTALGMSLHCLYTEAKQRLESTLDEIQDSGRQANWKWLKRHKSATKYAIKLKFGRVHYRPLNGNRERPVRRAASCDNTSLIAVFSGFLS